eukprot:Nitzschia sp. Nitz4//scaffold161_size51353//12235//12964//NITZ4_006942-RA/size51353-processed-gene-0.57-mRNA-1//1//CDS//3329537891//6579//frame0
MGLIHTPRVLFSVARGLMNQTPIDKAVGFSVPHKYTARVGLFDVDYMGHMNNAAYLSHAEYARWDMTSSNGLLQTFFKSNTHFVVTSVATRYRAEVRPIFRKFEIESFICAMDDKNMWISHNFRHAAEGDRRVRAQILTKGAALRNGKVIDLREFLRDKTDLDPAVIESMDRPHHDPELEAMITHLNDLDDSQRVMAARDDKLNSTRK